MISMKLVLRRAMVVMAVALSLAVGGLAVRAASAWTAAEAPLAAAPVSVKTLAQQLADEQARSATLESHLAALSGQSGDLSVALKAARARAAADAKAARILRDKLAATKSLAARQTRVKPAASRPAVATQPARTAAPVAVAVAPTRTAPPVQSTTAASGATTKPGGDDD
jgi:Skp family chaperone for outer membrane proteins